MHRRDDSRGPPVANACRCAAQQPHSHESHTCAFNNPISRPEDKPRPAGRDRPLLRDSYACDAGAPEG